MTKADQTVRAEYLKALQECKHLRATEKDWRKTIVTMAQDIDRLRAINAELVAALLHIKFGYTLAPASKEMVDAALAKAKGERT